VAGGIALDIEISQWFLIVTSFGSLFMVAGKRYGDFMELGEDRAGHRSSLALYTQHYLRYVWSISSGVTITAYCLWAFEQADLRDGFPFYQLSIVPFGLALLRYAYVIDTGDASAPEEVVIGDRQIQLLGVLWALTFGCGVYFT
jgi:decaprenyl-phosphate phosphoribosyltransferase